MNALGTPLAAVHARLNCFSEREWGTWSELLAAVEVVAGEPAKRPGAGAGGRPKRGKTQMLFMGDRAVHAGNGERRRRGEERRGREALCIFVST